MPKPAHEISIAKTTIKGDATVPRYLEVDIWYEVIRTYGSLYVFLNTEGNEIITSLKGSTHLHGGNFKLRKVKS